MAAISTSPGAALAGRGTVTVVVAVRLFAVADPPAVTRAGAAVTVTVAVTGALLPARLAALSVTVYVPAAV
jgi:hypothetical protein